MTEPHGPTPLGCELCPERNKALQRFQSKKLLGLMALLLTILFLPQTGWIAAALSEASRNVMILGTVYLGGQSYIDGKKADTK